MLNPGSEEAEALAEVEEMEEVSKDMQEDIGRLVSKLEKRKAAAVSISDKARNWIAVAKEQSEEIVQEAEKKAESILAGAAEEIKRWEAEKAELAGVQDFQPIVNLNVGGVRVTTSLTTLNRFPDSMIGCMFSGRHALPLGKDEHFFIDRDGTHFRHILNFLRSPEGYQVSRGADARELRRECEYYGIDQLMFPDHPLAKPQQQPQPQFYFQPQYQHMPQAQAQASSSISRLTSAGTEKSFAYFELRGHKVGTIAVRIDLAGVHTIRDSGEPIKMCRHCDRAIFAIGARKYFFRSLYMQSTIVAAQPKVQGICPGCDMLC
eukprot:CAMPEP_0173274124 /NCGR_PEP_ID=MMETSP1143-20121109/2274_1 /TAXON_ID=483371 /ORGANISM="non described non described, Strain CCMP2298" /LENGTH=319 /DNA_ID=CAMNT_0014210917 /DNA_START=1108 /DNA_END=2067 /DNA_ORIENTATION=-